MLFSYILDNEEADEIDPLDLMTPVNILDQIPKDFYEKVKSQLYLFKFSCS